MLLPLVALAAAAAATAIGGAPATGTRVERHSIYHNPHTHPAAPIPHTVEQAPRQPRRGLITEATPRGPEGPSPSAGPTRRWQEAPNTRKDTPSPNPTALHPHHAKVQTNRTGRRRKSTTYRDWFPTPFQGSKMTARGEQLTLQSGHGDSRNALHGPGRRLLTLSSGRAVISGYHTKVAESSS